MFIEQLNIEELLVGKSIDTSKYGIVKVYAVETSLFQTKVMFTTADGKHECENFSHYADWDDPGFKLLPEKNQKKANYKIKNVAGGLASLWPTKKHR